MQALSLPSPRWSTELLIDGERVTGGGPPLETVDPTTGESLPPVPCANADQIDRAVDAAVRALHDPSWRSGNGDGRRVALHRLADEIEAMHDELTAAIVTEVGSPVTVAESMQTTGAVQTLRAYADLAARDWRVPLSPTFQPASQGTVHHRPVGVVAVVSAYNYPILIAMRSVGAALAAGCTAVVVPSPRTPLTTLLLADAFERAGFPPGVVNIVVGGADEARHLTKHPDVAKIAFTGSLAVGKQVMRQAADDVKGVSLELGGKSATIVLPDFDFTEHLVAMHSRYLRNAGQGCGSPTRTLVPRERYDEFVERSAAAFVDFHTGDPWKRRTMIGPVIRAEHRDWIEDQVAAAVARGAEVVARGPEPDIDTGYFVRAALLGGLDNSWDIAQTEIFGPVGVVMPFDSIDEVIDIANDSPYGMAANLFTNDAALADALAVRLQVGTVFVNGGGPFNPDAPWGGPKGSGIGREYGEWGVREFLEPQHVQFAW